MNNSSNAPEDTNSSATAADFSSVTDIHAPLATRTYTDKLTRPAGAEAIKRKHPTGYDYVHSLIDDHSRRAYSEVLDDEKGTTCGAFLTRAAAYFAAHGILRIERLMTDNAWAYKHSLKAVCAQLGTAQKFIRPHCLLQNGKVERLNRTLATEMGL